MTMPSDHTELGFCSIVPKPIEIGQELVEEDRRTIACKKYENPTTEKIALLNLIG